MQILDPLFTIPLYYDSPKAFREKLQKKLEKEIKSMHPKQFADEKEEIEFLESRKSHFSSRYPSIHRYNNVLGYAELTIEANIIVIYFYLNGDKRKKYNKGARKKANTKAIYHSLYMVCEGLKGNSNEEIRTAVEGALLKLEKMCTNWNVYVNTARELSLIKYIDFEEIING